MLSVQIRFGDLFRAHFGEMVGGELASLMFFRVEVSVFGGVRFSDVHEEHVFDGGFGIDGAIAFWLFNNSILFALNKL